MVKMPVWSWFFGGSIFFFRGLVVRPTYHPPVRDSRAGAPCSGHYLNAVLDRKKGKWSYIESPFHRIKIEFESTKPQLARDSAFKMFRKGKYSGIGKKYKGCIKGRFFC